MVLVLTSVKCQQLYILPEDTDVVLPFVAQADVLCKALELTDIIIMMMYIYLFSLHLYNFLLKKIQPGGNRTHVSHKLGEFPLPSRPPVPFIPSQLKLELILSYERIHD